jgi:putative transposase
MVEYRKMSHSVSCMTVHLVWVTKYRYPVLQGDLQQRKRDLIIQICDSENVQILKGVVCRDHVHIGYRPSLSISVLVKKLKGRTSRILQIELPALKKQYWGRHF